MQETIGPYAIIRRLGEGGMGTVDLARHTSTGRMVAIKRVTRITGGMLDALRREVSSLAQIEHPNIVRIYDHDLRASTPWYAMEFIEGPSLRERLQNAKQQTTIFDSNQPTVEETEIWQNLPTMDAPRTAPADAPQTESATIAEDWLELLHSMIDVCAGLSGLHASGIVHRDLKPENILYRVTGEAVIVDFGISMLAQGAHGRERLTRLLRCSGTPAYLSPEQALSRPLDARTDLYSLGVMLFEIATGTLPFAQGSLIGVIQDHVYRAPPVATELNSDLPVGIQELIDRLLAKRPADRLGFAFDVDLALRREFNLPDPLYTPPSYVYAPELIGRAEELAELRDLANSLNRSGAHSVLISGQAGVGKTRLIQEFIQPLGHDLPMHIGSGTQGSQTPFRAFFSIWRSLAEQDPQSAQKFQSEFATWWQEIWSGSRPVNSSDIPMAMQLFASVCEQRKHLVILDDTQWLDPWSETLLENLLESPPERLGIIVLARQKGMFRCAKEIVLAPLNHAQTAQMIKSMVGVDNVAGSYVDFAYRESNGNPFLLAEMARTAMREGFISRDQSGNWNFAHPRVFRSADIPATQKIIATFNDQLKGLDRGIREGLHWCACLGGSADTGLLSWIAPEVDPQRLVESTLMYWDGLQLRFKQSMLSRLIYDQLDSGEKGQKHLKIADVLETMPDPNPFVLGRHLYRAGAHGRAEPYLLEAYEQA